MINENPLVAIIPNRTMSSCGPVNQKEFATLKGMSRKKTLSLNRTQVRMLSDVVLPYWQNYLKSIAHPLDEAYIYSLDFFWLDGFHSRDPKITRTALVVTESYMSIDLLPETIFFRIELCNRNVPHSCLIVHDGRGRYEFELRYQECDGLPH
jgi:hypothetical protein